MRFGIATIDCISCKEVVKPFVQLWLVNSWICVYPLSRGDNIRLTTAEYLCRTLSHRFSK